MPARKGMLSCITIARPQPHQLIGESISVAQVPPVAKPKPKPPARRTGTAGAGESGHWTPHQAPPSHTPPAHDAQQWGFAAAPPSSSSPRTPAASWSSASARSDRSSSLDDVIPPSVWRVGRPAARHPRSATPAQQRRRHVSMSHVGPAPVRASPAFWGVVKQAPRAPAARGNITARQDPAWQAAMRAAGKGISVTMGMYLDGEITVGGLYAATVLREPPCARCRMAGRECRVVDPRRERNLVSGICSYCIRQRRKCAS